MVQTTRDDFEMWLFDMDARLEGLVSRLPDSVAEQLDYSLESLDAIEGWLLQEFESVSAALDDTAKEVSDEISRYVGETIRKNAGGKWDIELEDEKNAYFKMPVLQKPDAWTECPASLVTAAVDRRNGKFISTVLNALLRRAKN